MDVVCEDGRFEDYASQWILPHLKSSRFGTFD